jgi:hypothetical protein
MNLCVGNRNRWLLGVGQSDSTPSGRSTLMCAAAMRVLSPNRILGGVGCPVADRNARSNLDVPGTSATEIC